MKNKIAYRCMHGEVHKFKAVTYTTTNIHWVSESGVNTDDCSNSLKASPRAALKAAINEVCEAIQARRSQRSRLADEIIAYDNVAAVYRKKLAALKTRKKADK